LDLARDDTERTTFLAMFLKEMFVVGEMRGRQATCVSIGMRRHFVVALRPVKWFESQIVTNARAAQAQR
jgi:hypothetical protein